MSEPRESLSRAWPWAVYITAHGLEIRHELTGTRLDIYEAARKLNDYDAERVRAGPPEQEASDLLHWLRGELCDIAGITVGDDQYPWKEILEVLRAGPPGEPTGIVELYDGWFADAISQLRKGRLLSDSRPVDEWLEEARSGLRTLAERRIAGPKTSGS